MARKKLLASLALTAGLLGGGAAGLILGVPSVSGAQTTAPDQAPRGDRENCPDKEGTEGRAPGGPSSSDAAFRRGPGGRV
ncbi:MAG TPA: hypothetical protein VHF27_10930 [Acidimicrobiales bacterium]|nr:hypothetical protein [Acidimicrobiales bacterium]